MLLKPHVLEILDQNAPESASKETVHSTPSPVKEEAINAKRVVQEMEEEVVENVESVKQDLEVQRDNLTRRLMER